ncbi:hypothetical protein BJ741DRAFT_582364 [Chytriomyces cf. hyalinus JEL632]|nr:hypothetical protein BJ741DRAFT_582364 [Chytriomyces cf. hyalinus JEL632]
MTPSPLHHKVSDSITLENTNSTKTNYLQHQAFGRNTLQAALLTGTLGGFKFKKWKDFFFFRDVWKAKYMSAKSQAEGTGFGITKRDISLGVTTVEEKLEKMCFMFLELDQLFGHCASVVPIHVSQTNVYELKSKDEVNGNETSNAMDGNDGSSIDERNSNSHNKRNSNNLDELLTGDNELDHSPMPPADPSAKPTGGYAPKNRSKTLGKKGKSTIELDLSSDSDLDSASAIRKNGWTSYMESQVPKLDLMEKYLVAQSKSAEATLALQREELMLKHEMSEKEYETWRLENKTKLKAE